MKDAAAGWLAGRSPSPPEHFHRWRVTEEEGVPLMEALTRAGMAALDRAVARPGREREAAWDLLEADGFITYACEAAVEQVDPEDGLLELLRRVGSPGR